jgi:hypothetical protein
MKYWDLKSDGVGKDPQMFMCTSSKTSLILDYLLWVVIF